LGLKIVKLDRTCIAGPIVRHLAELCPIVIAYEALAFPPRSDLLPLQQPCRGIYGSVEFVDADRRQCLGKFSLHSLCWGSTAFRLSMPFRDVSLAACLGMNRLGKYSLLVIARNPDRQARAVLWPRLQASRCAEQGRERPRALFFLLAARRCRPCAADAEIGGDVLALLSGKQ
jgi:hypothetical protein